MMESAQSCRCTRCCEEVWCRRKDFLQCNVGLSADWACVKLSCAQSVACASVHACCVRYCCDDWLPAHAFVCSISWHCFLRRIQQSAIGGRSQLTQPSRITKQREKGTRRGKQQAIHLDSGVCVPFRRWSTFDRGSVWLLINSLRVPAQAESIASCLRSTTCCSATPHENFCSTGSANVAASSHSSCSVPSFCRRSRGSSSSSCRRRRRSLHPNQDAV